MKILKGCGRRWTYALFLTIGSSNEWLEQLICQILGLEHQKWLRYQPSRLLIYFWASLYFRIIFATTFFTGLLDIIRFQFQCSHIFAAFPDRPRRKLSAAIWSLPLRCQRHSAHLYLRYLVMHSPTCLDSAGSSTMSKTLFLPIWSWTPSSGQSQAALMTN